MQAIPEDMDTAVTLERSKDQPTSPVEIASTTQTLTIRVDMRERQSGVPGLLAAFPDVTISFGALPSADYVLSEDVAVERKTASDFVSSILDRRLFGQLTRMKLLFPRALLLIEGDLTQVPHSIDMEAIRGALAFLAVREGVTVLQVAHATESAAMLHIMARHAQQRKGQPVSLREPRPPIEELYAAYLVEALPGVGPRRARMLLAHFGSPAAVMCASTEELAHVPGVGKKSAQRIWQAVKGCGNDSRFKQPYYISDSSRYPSDGNYTGPDAHLRRSNTVFERRPLLLKLGLVNIRKKAPGLSLGFSAPDLW